MAFRNPWCCDDCHTFKQVPIVVQNGHLDDRLLEQVFVIGPECDFVSDIGRIGRGGSDSNSSHRIATEVDTVVESFRVHSRIESEGMSIIVEV